MYMCAIVLALYLTLSFTLNYPLLFYIMKISQTFAICKYLMKTKFLVDDTFYICWNGPILFIYFHLKRFDVLYSLRTIQNISRITDQVAYGMKYICCISHRLVNFWIEFVTTPSLNKINNRLLFLAIEFIYR